MLSSAPHRFLVVTFAVVVWFVPSLSAAPIDDARALQRAGAYEAALERYRDVLASPSTDAVTRGIAHNNSCVVLTDLGRLDEALRACTSALEIRESLGDERAIGRTLNNLARVHQHRGDLVRAGEHFERALVINRQRDDHAAVAVNLNNLAALAITAGRDDRALRWLAQARAHCDRFPDATWTAPQRIFSTLNEGVVLERLGAFEQALDRYEPLLDDVDSLDRQRRADLAVNAATLYRNLGDPVRALERLDLAAKVYGELGAATGRATVQHNRGIVLHHNLGRPAEAEEALRGALRAANEAGAEPLEHDIRLTLATVLTDRRAFAEAESLLKTVGEAGHEPRWSTLAGLAALAFARDDLESASHWAGEAIQAIESARSRLDRESDRSSFLETQRPVYALAVDVLAAYAARTPGAGFAERAFTVVQRAKARALTERLGIDGPRPVYGSDAIRAKLGERILLSFFFTRRGLYRWRLDRHGVQLRSLGPPEPWIEAAHRAYEALRRDVLPVPDVVDRLGALVDDLDTDDRPVLISVDDALGNVPFALLLGTDRSIAYLPSASSLAHPVTRASAAGRGLLAIGAPRQPARDESSPTKVLIDRFGLGPLQASELATIGGQVPGTARVLTGPDATETAFVREVAAGASVLHVATHTVFDPRARRGGAIVLAGDDRHDGLLHADEVLDLDLDVELTVLAACRSAAGALDGGPALSSLAGAFLAAGSGAIVATLWDVGDHATAAIMGQLYFHLGRGATPAAALARSQATLRADSQWRDSSVWAAFVVIGDAPALPGTSRGRPWIGLLLGLVVGGGLLAWVRRRRA